MEVGSKRLGTLWKQVRTRVLCSILVAKGGAHTNVSFFRKGVCENVNLIFSLSHLFLSSLIDF